MVTRRPLRRPSSDAFVTISLFRTALILVNPPSLVFLSFAYILTSRPVFCLISLSSYPRRTSNTLEQNGVQAFLRARFLR
jgi:hypothetical protein